MWKGINDMFGGIEIPKATLQRMRSQKEYGVGQPFLET
jgi:hypothetical protein